MSRYSEILTQDLRNPTLISYLDLSRWLAAAIVFLGHLRGPLFLGYSDVPIESRTPWVKLWYFATGLHAEAVIVFFVLSGLLVAGVGATRVAEHTFDLRAYLIDRTSRLYIAFLPALLLCYMLDLIGSQNFREVGFWNHQHPMVAQKLQMPPFDSGMTVYELAANGLMLQHYWAKPLGSNQPLWTISTEFWFYMVFAGSAALVMFHGWRAVLASLLLAAIFAMLGSRFVIYLGCWLVGLGVVYVPRTKWLRPLPTIFAFGGLLFAVRLGQATFEESELLRTLKNYAVAIGFALTVSAIRGRRVWWLEITRRFHARLADFSYSLYLLHFPLMLFLLGALYHFRGFQTIGRGYDPTSTEGLGVYAFVIISVYAIAFLFSRGTEAHTASLRRFIKQRLPRPGELSLSAPSRT